MINMIRMKFIGYKQNIPLIIIMTAMSIIFMYVFGIGFSQEHKSNVYFVDQSHSEESESLINGMMKTKQFSIIEDTYEKAIQELENGQAIATVIIPENYKTAVREGDIKLKIVKVGNVMEHEILKQHIRVQISQSIGNLTFAQSVLPALKTLKIPMEKDTFINRINAYYQEKKIVQVETSVYEKEGEIQYDSLKQSFMGFILFFSLFTIVFGVGSIVEEKQLKVWHRQLVAPIGGRVILGATLFVGFIVGMIQMSLALGIGKFVFDIDLGGSFIALLLVMAAYVIAAMSLALLIISFVKTEQQLAAISPMIIVATSMLGGTMWPTELVTNKVVKMTAYITPQRWAMQGFKNIIIFRGGIKDVIEPIGYLCILAIVFFTISMIRYRKVT